jgi:hypothetical protein
MVTHASSNLLRGNKPVTAAEADVQVHNEMSTQMLPETQQMPAHRARQIMISVLHSASHSSAVVSVAACSDVLLCSAFMPVMTCGSAPVNPSST